MLSELDVTFIETVLLAFPETDEEMTLETMQPYWKALEKLVYKEQVGPGISQDPSTVR